MGIPIENYLHIGVDELKPMDKETAELFMKLTLSEMGKTGVRPITSESFTFDEEVDYYATIPKIIVKRLVYFGIDASEAVVLLCSFQSDNFAEAVMWAHTIAQIYHKTRSIVNIHTIANFFPVGFPSSEAKQELWDKQKFKGENKGTDNIIDMSSTWRSFKPYSNEGMYGRVK